MSRIEIGRELFQDLGLDVSERIKLFSGYRNAEPLILHSEERPEACEVDRIDIL